MPVSEERLAIIMEATGVGVSEMPVSEGVQDDVPVSEDKERNPFSKEFNPFSRRVKEEVQEDVPVSEDNPFSKEIGRVKEEKIERAVKEVFEKIERSWFTLPQAKKTNVSMLSAAQLTSEEKSNRNVIALNQAMYTQFSLLETAQVDLENVADQVYGCNSRPEGWLVFL